MATDPRRTLITGASGFVGCHLVPHLAASFPATDLFTEHVDVTDRDAIVKAVRDARPDVCIHLAAITAVAGARSDPDRAWRVNLHGALNLARAMLAFAPYCRLVFASSAEIYGRSFESGQPLDETALLAPMNSYAATKAAADLALRAMANDGLNVVRLRLFNHTGPGQSQVFVLPAFTRQIALIESGRQAPPLRVGGLDSRRDFLDVRGLCRVSARRSGTGSYPEHRLRRAAADRRHSRWAAGTRRAAHGDRHRRQPTAWHRDHQCKRRQQPSTAARLESAHSMGTDAR
jgi:GDP-4-dehydro-6-deoxy-D-mannose reductase